MALGPGEKLARASQKLSIAETINRASYCEDCGERPHSPSYERKCEGGAAIIRRDEFVAELLPILYPDPGPSGLERQLAVAPTVTTADVRDASAHAAELKRNMKATRRQERLELKAERMAVAA